jgi:uncharacterized protein (DUF302 family)
MSFNNGTNAAAEELLISASQYGARETKDRFVPSLAAHGMSVISVIDHSADAITTGVASSSSEVVTFSNSRGGGSFVVAAPTIAIDLTLRATVWQDANGDAWLAYNDPNRLAQRHSLPSGANAPLSEMARCLRSLA